MGTERDSRGLKGTPRDQRGLEVTRGDFHPTLVLISAFSPSSGILVVIIAMFREGSAGTAEASKSADPLGVRRLDVFSSVPLPALLFTPAKPVSLFFTAQALAFRFKAC